MEVTGRLRSSLAEVGLAIAGLLAGVVVWTIVASVLPLPERFGPALGLMAGPIITVAAWATYRLFARKSDDGGWLGPAPQALVAQGSVGHAFAWVGLGVLAAILGSYVLGQLMTLLGAPVEEQGSILEVVEAARNGSVLPLVGLAIAATIAAPIAEELLFRGLVFARILGRGHRTEAFVLSSAAFAAIHTNPAGFVVYLWLGLVFAESYRRSGRLWVAMLVHAGNNAFALSLLVYFS